MELRVVNRGLVALALIATSLLGADARPASATDFPIHAVAGMPSHGFSGDSGPATSAKLNNVYAAVADNHGNIFIADHDNHRIRKVNSSGIISTYAGDGSAGYSGDGGLATAASISGPEDITFDAYSNLYFADTGAHVVRKIDTSGVISTFAGTGVDGFSGDGGAAASATLSKPVALAFDRLGNLFIGDVNQGRVRKVTSAGVISTFAGTGVIAYGGDGGPAAAASFSSVNSLKVDSQGRLVVSSYDDARVRRIDTSGVVTTIAGTGVSDSTGDGGPATIATLAGPEGIAIDAADNLYIADYEYGTLRRVDASSGIISTVGGTGVDDAPPDGTPLRTADITPWSVSLDANGTLYIVSDYSITYSVAAFASAYRETTVAAMVDYALTFTVGAHTGACNGVSQTVGALVSSNSVSLGHVTSGSNNVGAQDLTIGTNGAGGFSVYVRNAAPMNDGSGHTIADVGASNGAPAAFPSAGISAFGYTTSDATLGIGTPDRFTTGGAKWAKLTTTNAEVAFEPAPAQNVTCVGYQVGVSNATAAGAYSAAVTYTAVPTF